MVLDFIPHGALGLNHSAFELADFGRSHGRRVYYCCSLYLASLHELSASDELELSLSDYEQSSAKSVSTIPAF
jgi:hypothetical protein